MTATDGNELYAWQVQEADTGEWSMVGAMIPDFSTDPPTRMHTPLIQRKRDVAELMRPLAESHAARTDQPLRLARFTVTEVLEGEGR